MSDDFPEETGRQLRPLLKHEKPYFDTRDSVAPFEHGRVMYAVRHFVPPQQVKRLCARIMQHTDTACMTFDAMEQVVSFPFRMAAYDPRLELHADPTMQLPFLMRKPHQTSLFKYFAKTFDGIRPDPLPCALVVQRKGMPEGIVLRHATAAHSFAADEKPVGVFCFGVDGYTFVLEPYYLFLRTFAESADIRWENES